MSEVGRPRVSLVHVSPPSMDLWMPLPGPPPHVAVGAAFALEGRRVEDVRIGRVHDDVGRPGVLVDREHGLPALAAVHRPVHAAFAAGCP